MRKAARALASASLLADDGDHEGACNRAYYAMFDADTARQAVDEASRFIHAIRTRFNIPE